MDDIAIVGGLGREEMEEKEKDLWLMEEMNEGRVG